MKKCFDCLFKRYGKSWSQIWINENGASLCPEEETQVKVNTQHCAAHWKVVAVSIHFGAKCINHTVLLFGFIWLPCHTKFNISSFPKQGEGNFFKSRNYLELNLLYGNLHQGKTVTAFKEACSLHLWRKWFWILSWFPPLESYVCLTTNSTCLIDDSKGQKRHISGK